MFRTRVSVGLDIGDYSVKVAVVNPHQNQVLHLLEAELLPERAFQDDLFDEHRIHSTIKTVLSPVLDPKARYKPTFAASYRGDEAFYRYLELPPLKRGQQETAIGSALSKMLSYPVLEASVTALPVPVLGPDSQNTGTFVMAFPRSSLEQHRQLLTRCDLEIARVEPSALALLRTLTANHGSLAGEFVALLEVGSRRTMALVLREGHPYFAREFAVGGTAFTYAFQMAAQSTWQDAELYKRRYDATAREVAIEPVLTRWLDQAKRSLEAFTKNHPELSPKVQRVFLAGGSSSWTGLAPRLEETLGIPVRTLTWDRLVPPQQPRQASPGSFATALGLALE